MVKFIWSKLRLLIFKVIKYLSGNDKALNAFIRAQDLASEDQRLRGEILNNKACCKWFNGENEDE